MNDNLLSRCHYPADCTRGCVDINECEQKPCDVVAVCINYNGGYECKCPIGYRGHGTKENPCKVYKMIFYSCSDVDECEEGIHNCTSFENCGNTRGSFLCDCKSGFEQRGSECININECVEKTHNCLNTEVCEDRVPGFICKCKQGYIHNQVTKKCESKYLTIVHINLKAFLEVFNDDDGMAFLQGNPITQEAFCGKNTICKDVPGFAVCECKANHHGDPYAKEGCKPVNVCDRKPCKKHEVCKPATQLGEYICECSVGYIMNAFDGECIEDPRLKINCTGGDALLRVDPEKQSLKAICVCDIDMVYDERKDRCISSDVCECGEAS
uniref:EGF-like domain-containing protein n=1 Tax=Heterorhabditis bacteriophora TaxID=37862 RepID=A0A1I7W652_HETBA